MATLVATLALTTTRTRDGGWWWRSVETRGCSGGGGRGAAHGLRGQAACPPATSTCRAAFLRRSVPPCAGASPVTSPVGWCKRRCPCAAPPHRTAPHHTAPHGATVPHPKPRRAPGQPLPPASIRPGLSARTSHCPCASRRPALAAPRRAPGSRGCPKSVRPPPAPPPSSPPPPSPREFSPPMPLSCRARSSCTRLGVPLWASPRFKCLLPAPAVLPTPLGPHHDAYLPSPHTC